MDCALLGRGGSPVVLLEAKRLEFSGRSAPNEEKRYREKLKGGNTHPPNPTASFSWYRFLGIEFSWRLVMNSVKVPLIWSALCFSLCVPLLALDHAVGFDVSTSPVWQLGFHYSLFGSLSLLVYGAAAYLFFPRVAGWRWLCLGLAALVMAGVFILGFLYEGAYPGFRNDRLGDLLGLFAVVSPFVVILFRPVLLRLKGSNSEGVPA